MEELREIFHPKPLAMLLKMSLINKKEARSKLKSKIDTTEPKYLFMPNPNPLTLAMLFNTSLINQNEAKSKLKANIDTSEPKYVFGPSSNANHQIPLNI